MKFWRGISQKTRGKIIKSAAGTCRQGQKNESENYGNGRKFLPVFSLMRTVKAAGFAWKIQARFTGHLNEKVSPAERKTRRSFQELTLGISSPVSENNPGIWEACLKTFREHIEKWDEIQREANAEILFTEIKRKKEFQKTEVKNVKGVVKNIFCFLENPFGKMKRSLSEFKTVLKKISCIKLCRRR